MTFGFLLLMGSCELLGKASLASVAAAEDRLPDSDGVLPPGFELAAFMDAIRDDVGLVICRSVGLGKVMVNDLSCV